MPTFCKLIYFQWLTKFFEKPFVCIGHKATGPNGYPIPDPNPKFLSITNPYLIFFLRIIGFFGYWVFNFYLSSFPETGAAQHYTWLSPCFFTKRKELDSLTRNTYPLSTSFWGHFLQIIWKKKIFCTIILKPLLISITDSKAS